MWELFLLWTRTSNKSRPGAICVVCSMKIIKYLFLPKTSLNIMHITATNTDFPSSNRRDAIWNRCHAGGLLLSRLTRVHDYRSDLSRQNVQWIWLSPLTEIKSSGSVWVSQTNVYPPARQKYICNHYSAISCHASPLFTLRSTQTPRLETAVHL
jgi:hypothetical protein